MAMTGNGCRINGMVTITARPLMEVHGKEMALTGLFGAVAGHTAQGAASQRFTPAATPTPTATISAFAFSGICNHFTPLPLTKLSQIVNKYDVAVVQQQPARPKKSVRRTAQKKYCTYFL